MRKILAVLTAILIMSSVTAYAALNYRSTQVVIIGGAEFKTPDYYKIIKKTLGKKTQTPYDAGDEIQRKYQIFMMERYDIGEDMPRKQDLIDFAASTGYGEVLFLMLDENVDTQNNPKSRQKNRISVQLDAYLVDGSRIIDMNTTSQDFNSKTSNLRARRGAFEKCLKEIATKMNLQ